MTDSATSIPGPSAATQPLIISPDDAIPVVQRLDVPGTVYEVRPGRESGSAIVCEYDFIQADAMAANPVAPTWSNPDLVLTAYGLAPTRELATALLNEVFPGGRIDVQIERNAESGSPELVFALEIPKALRDRRAQFLDRYVRDAVLPPTAPVPVILWSYK